MSGSASNLGKMVFRKADNVSVSAFSSDLKTFNLLMAIDGVRDLQTICREEGYSLEAIEEIVRNLWNRGVIATAGTGPSPAPSAAAPSGDLAELKSLLGKVVGPVAGMLIQKAATQIGCDPGAVPPERFGQLVERISAAIPDPQKAADFKIQARKVLGG